MEKSFWKPSNSERFKLEDQKFIDVILTDSKDPIEHIIKRYQKDIEKMIWHKYRSELNSEEIFYEGLSRFIYKIKNNKFKGKSSNITYLNKICYHICLDEIFKNRTEKLENDVELEEDGDDFSRIELVIKIKKQIDEKCRVLIDLRFNVLQDKCLSFNEIAEVLNINVENAKKRLHRCMDKLRELIEFDPELREYNT